MSFEGRPLVVEFCGDPAAGLRVFLIAGQHGDEPDTRMAAAALVERTRCGAFDPRARLAVLADANPDGAAANRRRNATNIDLNRDHLLLRAPETSAIHRFVESWQPDLILDVHTYRPRRRELLPFDFVFPHDVMIDVPTNPAARTSLEPPLERSLLAFVTQRMAEASLRCDRYTLVRPNGRVRHSNLDIVDARNGLSLRHGIPTVLIEGRRASEDDPASFAPTHVALLRAIEAVIEWGGAHAGSLKKRPDPIREPVPIDCRYSRSARPRYMEMQSAAGDIQVVGIPGAYLPFVATTRTVRVPRAYAVPRASRRLVGVLARQQFRDAPAERFRNARLEVYRADTSGPSYAQPWPDAVYYPADQPGGRALALLLEPQSRFGLHRFADLFPVARVV